MPAGREALDASLADLTVKTAFSPSASPTQRERLAIFLLMSAQPAKGKGG